MMRQMSDDSAKTEFRRDPETGLLMAYRDGTLVGPIIGMGDFPGPRDLRRVRSIVKDIYRAVTELEDLYPGRRFTPDGHMVGSIGEVVAAERYGLNLFEPSHPVHDAYDHNARLIQIKTTQGTKIGINEEPDYLIVLHMSKEGEFEEVYNGPGKTAWEAAGKPMKNGQRQLSLSKLRILSLDVRPEDRIEEAVY